MFRFPVSPRYLEVDQQGVVFNMWYLGYADEAWAAFMAHLGFAYPDLLVRGDDVMLVHSELDWSSGLRYGEAAEIEVGVERLGTTSMVFTFDVQRDGVTTCRIRTVYVVVATDGSGRKPVPEDLRRALAPHLDRVGPARANG